MGYIEEEEDEQEKEEVKPEKNAEEATGEWAERSRRLSSRDKNRAFRIAGKAVLMQARLSRGGSTFELVSERDGLLCDFGLDLFYLTRFDFFSGLI